MLSDPKDTRLCSRCVHGFLSFFLQFLTPLHVRFTRSDGFCLFLSVPALSCAFHFSLPFCLPCYSLHAVLPAAPALWASAGCQGLWNPVMQPSAFCTCPDFPEASGVIPQVRQRPILKHIQKLQNQFGTSLMVVKTSPIPGGGPYSPLDTDVIFLERFGEHFF